MYSKLIVFLALYLSTLQTLHAAERFVGPISLTSAQRAEVVAEIKKDRLTKPDELNNVEHLGASYIREDIIVCGSIGPENGNNSNINSWLFIGILFKNPTDSPFGLFGFARNRSERMKFIKHCSSKGISYTQ